MIDIKINYFKEIHNILLNNVNKNLNVACISNQIKKSNEMLLDDNHNYLLLLHIITIEYYYPNIHIIYDDDQTILSICLNDDIEMDSVSEEEDEEEEEDPYTEQEEFFNNFKPQPGDYGYESPEEEEEEEEEDEEEVYEVVINGKSYFTNSTTNGTIYENVEDDVGEELGTYVNGKPIFN